jgi:hypothetical protein
VTDQLDGNKGPKRFANVREWAQDWLDQRKFEYPVTGHINVDECTDAALPDMPIRFQDEARRQRCRGAFEGIARNLGMKSLGRTKGQSVYGFVPEIETLFDLWIYANRERKQIGGRTSGLVASIREWFKRHPADQLMSEDEFIKSIEQDEPPEALSA